MNKKLRYLFAILIITALAITAVMLYRHFQKPIAEEVTEVVEELFDEHNISLNRFNRVTKSVSSGQTVGTILNGNGISYSIVEQINLKAAPFFDLRSIREGKTYHLYFSNDSLESLLYFVYDISSDSYLHVGFGDTLDVRLVKHDVTVKTVNATGIITSSLWNTMKANELDPNLAIGLSEIFAWVVDFYRIQKNDRFKIIYEDKYVGDKSIGSGRIKAALFEHSGKLFYAFHFEKDTLNDYYNEKGESLRKAFLKAPLKFSRVTSGFTHKRFHPVLKRNKAHLGTDYAAPTGTPIMTVGDGVVLEARYHGGNGNYVKIRHNSVYTTQYLHMSKFAKGIKPGVFVKQGDIIGYVGSTGLSTGPHVCFRFWKNGEQVNHLKEEFPNTAPLDSAYHDTFFHDVKWYMEGFERMKYGE